MLVVTYNDSFAVGDGSSAMMSSLILCYIFFLLFLPAYGQLPVDPDKNLLTPQFIASRGFIPQFHSVVTVDGYYIGIHRIIHPFHAPTRQPVLFVSISGGSSVEWLRNSPGGSVNESTAFVGANIGFEVARRGYDVWLLDNRGNYDYSYNHTKYNLDHDLEYWDFAMDELGLFDLSAAIDYIRAVTSKEKVALITIQTSSTTYFFLASKVPRFNQIVQPFIALSPGWSQAHSRASILMKSPLPVLIEVLKERRGQFLQQWILKIASKLLCNSLVSQTLFCNPLVYLGLIIYYPNRNPGSINFDRLALYIFTGPSFGGSSWQWAQQLSFSLTERITMLDVSPEMNMRRYGSALPPEYKPEDITNTEMHFFSAPSDQFSDPIDLSNFKQRLGANVRSEVVIPIQFQGVGFLDGAPADVIRYVNIPILLILGSYN